MNQANILDRIYDAVSDAMYMNRDVVRTRRRTERAAIARWCAWAALSEHLGMSDSEIAELTGYDRTNVVYGRRKLPAVLADRHMGEVTSDALKAAREALRRKEEALSA